MTKYDTLMARRFEIMLASTGIDYESFYRGPIIFDYEAMMATGGYSTTDVAQIQARNGVGSTPLLELPNISALVRQVSEPGRGARIFIKDEATNPSGSFKDRRSSMSAHHAKSAGFKGIAAATSGNYGAAVASQAARHGLRAIIVQETFDSGRRGQPEILEKGRKCEVLGAEVLQTTVGPELHYLLLKTLEETGYFSASLNTPFSIQGIETLGHEIVHQTRDATGRDPDVVLVTHAGGGNITGTARGLRAAGADSTKVVAVSVDLAGLHMASDTDFNLKSFTTGHTGFSIPSSGWPDRVDVPKNAARPLRYMDQFLTVTQGEVFFATELLARVEGLERGPAGNTSLAAAIPVAREMAEDEVLVISETEYTGAGKSPVSQLEFAEKMGVDVIVGDPRTSVPGKVIALPKRLDEIRAPEIELDRLRATYLKQASRHKGEALTAEEEAFIQTDMGLATGGSDG